MKSASCQSLNDIIKNEKNDFLNNYENDIKFFEGYGIKLSFEFNSYNVKKTNKTLLCSAILLYPEGSSKSKAKETYTFKYISLPIAKIMKKDGCYVLKSCTAAFHKFYIKLMKFQLKTKGFDFINENFFDLFIKLLFKSNNNEYFDTYRGHRIEKIRIAICVVFVIVVGVVEGIQMRNIINNIIY